MMEFYEAFEKLTGLMTTFEGFDLPEIFSTLGELCKILRVSKGVTTFYASPEDEKKGFGEPFVCFDSGEEHVLVSTIRRVTPARTSIICDVYQAKGAEPFNETEKRRVEIIQRMMLTCVNETRQQKMINSLIYKDDNEYYNLRYFYAVIGKRIASGISGLSGISAARLNLKHFSLINERIGCENGDKVMRKYCMTLEDAGGKDALVCRLGGDNFVMLFNTDHINSLTQCIAGIPVSYNENEERVEVSAVAGLWNCTNPMEVRDPGVVMAAITIAYQIAKRRNTDDIVFYTDEIKRQKVIDIEITRKFNQALTEGEFVAFYQPKVDIKTREIIGAEALCRWHHGGQLIPPLEFIPILEQGSDICRLDFYMLDRTCKDIRRWMDEGKPVVKVSVNFSRRHMIDPDLARHIIDIVDRNGVPHEYIEVELTETTTDVEFRELKKTVKGLQDSGISTSVDDFGVGYSSLNLIKQIPWNILKLDKSILPANGEDIERGSRMFAHVIAMAHEIGMVCIAEGVETEEQLEIMSNYGCRLAQGFLFDRPLPVQEFEKRLKTGSYLQKEQE